MFKNGCTIFDPDSKICYTTSIAKKLAQYPETKTRNKHHYGSRKGTQVNFLEPSLIALLKTNSRKVRQHDRIFESVKREARLGSMSPYTP